MAFDLKELSTRDPEPITEAQVAENRLPLEEIGLTTLYICAAGLWTVFADDFFDFVMGQPLDSGALHAMKGINFITTTSIVLYLVLRRTVRSRRLAQEAHRLSQQRFEFVAMATTDAIWDLNLDTKVMWWSDGVRRLFGYRQEEVSTRFDWWLDHLHPDDRGPAVDAVRRVAESGARTWVGEYRLRRQDGTYAIVSDRGYILRDSSGKPTRIVCGISDISERRRAEEALENSRQQLRALTARLQSSREEERATVAREIHDELGQALTSIKIDLDWLERKLESASDAASMNPLIERVVESTSTVDRAIVSVQRIATDLRPAVLDDLGLLAALDLETRRFEQRTGMACALQLPEELSGIRRDVATAIFRVFQECLTNAARHGKATAIQVSLRKDPGVVVLEVEDNGQGIKPESITDPGSMGLLGMRERAAVLGGVVAISPISPNGTRVTLRVPLPEETPKEPTKP